MRLITAERVKGVVQCKNPGGFQMRRGVEEGFSANKETTVCFAWLRIAAGKRPWKASFARSNAEIEPGASAHFPNVEACHVSHVHRPRSHVKVRFICKKQYRMRCLGGLYRPT